jgi:hypothetical protein
MPRDKEIEVFWEREIDAQLVGRGSWNQDTEEPAVMARRLVVQQCIYGVDKNSFAVDLAKLSPWLFTMRNDAINGRV